MKKGITFLSGLLTGMVLILAVQLIGMSPQRFVALFSPQPDFSSGETPQLPRTSDEFSKSYGSIDSDWVLKELGADRSSLREFQGKVVFLNMWATWCSPCIREIPEIQKLMVQLEGEVVFLLVSPEEEKVVSEFVAGNTYEQIQFEELPIYISEDDPPGQIYTGTWPTTYID